MNSLSSIPDNFFQGIGKPKIPTLMMLFELPVYVSVMWFSINWVGIKGAAFTFMIAAGMNALIMYIIAYKLFAVKFESRMNSFSFLLMMCGLIIPFYITSINIKIIFAVGFLTTFLFATWKYFLSVDEKSFLVSRLKINFK